MRGEYTASFAALFPADNPQLVVVVKIDNPTGKYYGGLTAAPVTRTMLQQALASRRVAIDRSRLTPRDSTAPRVQRRAATPAGMARVVLPWPYQPDRQSAVTRAVPDVAGRSVREAALALHRRGFRVSLRGLGRVSRTQPAGGRKREGRNSSDRVGRRVTTSMPLTWTAVLDELRRADLLTAAPPKGDDPTGVGVDSRTLRPGNDLCGGSRLPGGRSPVCGRCGWPGREAIVVEAPQQSDVPEIVVRDSHRAALVLGSAWYGHPAQAVTLIGVTGTNGKTTTTGLIRHLFNQRETAGSIGTLGAFDGTGQPITSTAGSLTTPGPIDLQATLAAMVDRGVTHVAMETSSHSLDQRRLDGLTFAAGVFTNLTRDHLDYHGTMEAYLASKLRLSTLLGLNGIEVVNLDDVAWQVMPARVAQADLRASPRCRRSGQRSRPRRRLDPDSRSAVGSGVPRYRCRC